MKFNHSMDEFHPYRGWRWGRLPNRLRGTRCRRRDRGSTPVLQPAISSTRLAHCPCTLALASLYSDLGDPAGLDGVADALRHFFPDSRGAYYYTAASQFLHQDLAAAERSVQLALAVDSRFAPAHNLAGAIQASQGNAEQARAAFRAALTLDPRDLATYTNLARLELSAGRASASAGLFAEALSLDPSSASARQGLADAQRAIRGR